MVLHWKWLVVGCVCILVFGAACGGGDSDDTDDTTPTTGVTATSSTNPPGTTATSAGSPTAPAATPTATVTNTPQPTATPTVTPTPTPIPTVDNTPPLVVISSSGGPLGGTATMTIRSKVGIECSVVFVLPDGTPVNVAGLDPQIVGPDGSITWTWTLDPSFPTGSAQAQVTCEKSRRAAIIEITP